MSLVYAFQLVQNPQLDPTKASIFSVISLLMAAFVIAVGNTGDFYVSP